MRNILDSIYTNNVLRSTGFHFLECYFRGNNTNGYQIGDLAAVLIH